ncbi:hypothetical protein CTheo_873 [Ceratobasidium theobromae]|uniref:Uncharacterized protein n=1 Tax=Ceratobasidium theobromae TaxID=1582974 RepID=A0A5N5QV45_9AGAM|nr:hypothetical protein CTheo_873 [Ceratobasidium theobromae]
MFARLVAAPLRVAGSRSYSGFFSSSKPPGGIVKQAQTGVVKRTTATTNAPDNPQPAQEPASLPSPTPIPTMHPSPVLSTLHLHSFFSLDRPMLLLSQPTSRLFTTEPPPRTQADDAGETDSDADAARALSHALVMSKVQSAALWADTMAHLGIPVDAGDMREEARVQSDLDVLMDSVRRKRRKKITKHK